MNAHALVSSFQNHSGRLWVAIIIVALMASSVITPVVTDGTTASFVLEQDPAEEPIDQALPADVPADWWTAAQENIRQEEYKVSWQDQTYLPDLPAAYQAPNRAHNFRSYFTPDGIRLIPRVLPEEGGESPWEWKLTLTGYGYAGAILPVPSAELLPNASRMEYQRGTITEWYVNDARGLEQGFTLTAPPQNSISHNQSEIILELTLSGNVTPYLANDGAIEFTSPGGIRVLRYGDLVAYDATGRALKTRFSLNN